MSDWAYFLYRVGRTLSEAACGLKARPTAFLSVPFLDYASIFVASGVLARRYESADLTHSDLDPWRTRIGESVIFPFKKLNGGTELRRRVGIIESIEKHKGIERIEAKILDSDGKKYTRAIDPRWMSLVSILDEFPDLETRTLGSLLAENIEALDDLLGETGSCHLLEKASRDCLILDVKGRIQDETKQAISLSRLGMKTSTQQLVLRDLIRLESEGPVAMIETSCCRVAPEAEPGWFATIMAGSLNFTKEWDNSDSPLRIILLCQSDNAYPDAINLANNIYMQRTGKDFEIPSDLLATKPATIDIQLMFS